MQIRVNIAEIMWKPVDCQFLLSEELYRIPCILIHRLGYGKHTEYRNHYFVTRAYNSHVAVVYNITCVNKKHIISTNVEALCVIHMKSKKPADPKTGK